LDNWKWKQRFAEEQAAIQEEEKRWEKKLSKPHFREESSETVRQAQPKKAGKRVKRTTVRSGLLAREADAHKSKTKPP